MKTTFTKKVIATVNNEVGQTCMNTFLVGGDLNNNGRPDLVVSGWNGRMVWLENQGDAGWVEHPIDDHIVDVECGGSLIDLTGNGYPDIICGSADGGTVWWWQNPGISSSIWEKHTILHTGRNFFHDTAIGDAKNDGRIYLVMNNQRRPEGTVTYCVPIPEDPTTSPWPEIQIIAEQNLEWLETPDGQRAKQQPEEGLAIGDIDGDGFNEVVVGNHWYKYTDGQWEGHKFACGYITNKVAIGDIDGDGQNEIVLAEGDPMIYGKTQGGRLGWFKPGPDPTQLWTEHILDDGLLDAHSLQLGDICGNGRLDIMTGEIGWADEKRGYKRRAPWVLLYKNLGGGAFARYIVDQGTGSHEAVLVDLRGNGRLDFVCKPLHGPDRWNIVVLYQD